MKIGRLNRASFAKTARRAMFLFAFAVLGTQAATGTGSVDFAAFVDALKAANNTFDGSKHALAQGGKLTVKWSPVSGCYDMRAGHECTVGNVAATANTPKRVNSGLTQFQLFEGESHAVNVKNVAFVYEPAAFTVCENSDWKGTFTAEKAPAGQIYLMNTGDVTFEGCTFDKVVLTSFNCTGTSTVKDCSFKNVYNSYAVKDIRGAKVAVTGCAFENCGAAVMVSSTENSKVEKVTISGNTFTKVDVAGTTPDSKVGTRGLVQIASSGDYADTAFDFSGNTATDCGPVLRQLNSTVSFDTDDKTDLNKLVSTGGSLYTGDSVPAAKIGEKKYDSLEAALADVAEGKPLTWVAEGSWPVKTPVYYNGTFYETGTGFAAKGALERAIDAANAEGAAAVAKIYVRPGFAADELVLQAHQQLKTGLAIYGNDAKLSCNWEPCVEYPGTSGDSGAHQLTKDVSLAIYNLHNGAGFWGRRTTAYTVDLKLSGCRNAHQVMFYGNADTGVKGKTNISVTNCTFDATNKETGHNVLVTIGAGTVDVSDTTFTAANINVKNVDGGDNVITVKDCTFKDTVAGNQNIRVRSYAEGTHADLTIENVTFAGDSTQNVEIGDSKAECKGVVNYTITKTSGTMNVYKQGVTTAEATTLDAAVAYSGDNVGTIADEKALRRAFCEAPTDGTAVTVTLGADITLETLYAAENFGTEKLDDNAEGDTFNRYKVGVHPTAEDPNHWNPLVTEQTQEQRLVYGAYYHMSATDERIARLVVKAGQKIVLDLNGHTIQKNARATHGDWSEVCTDIIGNYGTLEIVDSSTGAKGTIKGIGYISCQGAVLHNYAGATMTVTGVNVDGNAAGMAEGTGQYVVSNEGGTLTIDGANVHDTATSASLIMSNGGMVTIKNATLSHPATKVINAKGGVINIESASVTSEEYAVFVTGDARVNVNGSLTIEGTGTLCVEGDAAALTKKPGVELSAPAGFTWVENDGVQVLKSFVAKVGETKYATLAEALSEANSEGALCELIADVTLKGTWTSILNFKGTFDGKDHKITGLNVSGSEYVGLIGVLDGGTVKNVQFASVDVSGGTDAGSAVGRIVNDGTVDNVKVLSGTVKGTKRIGGVVGSIKACGTVKNCENAAKVEASTYNVGGIVGAAYYTETSKEMYITNCRNTADITSAGVGAGGIVGLSCANVSGNTNTGAVKGKEVGGIVGEQKTYGSVTDNTNSGAVTNTGTDTDNWGTGGIIGWLRYHGTGENYAYEKSAIITVSGNINNGMITGGNDAGGIVGVVYNSAVITDNSNTAATLSGTTFAAGIVGNYQITETPAAGEPAKNKLTFTRNTSTTALDNITANNKDLLIYDNREKVAQIGDKKYATLEDAVEAAKIGDTIKVIANDVSLSAPEGWTISESTLIPVDKTWHIANLDQLKEFQSAVNGGNTFDGQTVVFDKDIDMVSVENWTPIGNVPEKKFAGTFDGQNHTISGLKITGGSYVGLFGYLGAATVQNVALVGANVSGVKRVGALVGQIAGNATIKNCSLDATSSVAGSDSNTGGLIGEASGSIVVTLENLTNNAPVTNTESGTSRAAGILCQATSGASVTLKNCVNKGTITTNGGYAGGIVSAKQGGASLVFDGCSNTGTLANGTKGTGALLAWSCNGSSVTISNYSGDVANAIGWLSQDNYDHVFVINGVEHYIRVAKGGSGYTFASRYEAAQLMNKSYLQEIIGFFNYAKTVNPNFEGYPATPVEVLKSAYSTSDESIKGSLFNTDVSSGWPQLLSAYNVKSGKSLTADDFAVTWGTRDVLFMVSDPVTVVVTDTASAQAALDAATPNTTIIFKSGTYEPLFIRQTLEKSTRRSDLDKDGSYPAYLRSFKNLTLIAEVGAEVVSKGITAEAGLFWHASAPASNQAEMRPMGGFISYLALENVTIDGIAFDSTEQSAVTLRDNGAVPTRGNIMVDGLTIQNCTGRGVASNENIHFLAAGGGTNDQNFPGTEKKSFNNIVVKNCELDSYYQPIAFNNATAVLNGLTVTGNTFSNNGNSNVLQLSNKVNSGAFVIENNLFKDLNGRVVRATNSTANWTITGNRLDKPIMYDDSGDLDLVKISVKAETVGAAVTESENDWNTGTLANGTYIANGDPALLPVARIGENKYYHSLQAAFDAAKDGETVKLLADVTVAGQLVAEKALTLDLGGKTVTSTYANGGYAFLTRAAVTVKNGTFAAGQARALSAYANLTLEDATITSELAGGNCCVAFSAANCVYTVVNTKIVGAYAIANFAHNATIAITGSTLEGSGCGLYHNGSNYGLKLTVSDTTINGAIDQAIGEGKDPSGVYLSGSLDMLANAANQNGAHGRHQATFTRCTIKGNTGVEVKYTDLTLEDCTVVATTKEPSYTQNNNGMAALGFAVVSTDNATGNATPKPEGTITITGADGSYTGLVGLGFLDSVKTGFADFEDAHYAVSGGTFSTAVLPEYCAAGFIPTANDDGTYGVKAGAYVAAIGTTGYETLEAALAAADAGATVKMLADVVLTEKQTIAKAVVLDLNGKTISSMVNQFITIAKGGDLTVNDATGEGRIENTTTEFWGGTILMTGGVLTVNGGTLAANTATGAYSPVIEAKSSVTINVAGGRIEANRTGSVNAIQLGQNADATLNVTGGTIFGGKIGVYSYQCTGNVSVGNRVNVSGGEIIGKSGNAVYAAAKTGLSISGGTLTPGGTAAALAIGGGSTTASSCTVTVGREGGVVGDVTIPSIDFKPGYSANMATVNLLSGIVQKFLNFDRMTVATVSQGKDKLLVGTDITACLPGSELLCQLDAASGLYEIVKLTVENAAAIVTHNGVETLYRTVQQARTAVADDDTLTLKMDYTGSLGITKKNVTIDLGGKTLTGASNSHALSFNQSAAGDNTVTVKNGTIVAKGQDAACIRATSGDAATTLTLVLGDDLTLEVGSNNWSGKVVLDKGARTASPRTAVNNGGLLVTEDGTDWIYGETETAFTHAAGTEVTLLNDWYCTDYEGAVKVPDTSAFGSAKLNLDGHTIKHYGAGAAIVMGNDAKPSEGTAVKTLEISNGMIETSQYGAAVCGSNKSLTLDGVSVKTTGDDKLGIYANGMTSGNTVTLKNGSAVVSEKATGIYFPGAGTLTVEDSNVTGGMSGIEVRAGVLNVSGTSVIESTAAEFSFTNDDNGITATGAAVAAVKHTVGNDLAVTITGGTFKGPRGFYANDPNVAKPGTVTVSISGGAFSTDVEKKYLADGCKTVQQTIDGTLYYVVGPAITQIGVTLGGEKKEMPFPDAWLAANIGADASRWTTAALEEKAANELAKWQCYLFGLDPNKKDVKVVATAGQGTDKAIPLAVANADASASPLVKDGYVTVAYVLMGSNDGTAWTQVATSDKRDGLVIPLTGTTYKFYRVDVTVTSAEGN